MSCTGCAMAYVRSFDKDQVEICPNKIASQDYITEKAEKHCGTNVELLGSNVHQTGVEYKYAGFQSGYQATEQRCYTYRCIR